MQGQARAHPPRRRSHRERMDAHRVLIVTDGYLSMKEPSPLAALRKQIQVHRSSVGAWLDLRIKLLVLERVLPAKLFERSRTARNADYAPTVRRLRNSGINLGAPELTEIVLMTALAEQGMPYEATTYATLAANPSERERLISACDCVFASATMLRGLPELTAIGALLKRSHNHVVVGGALTGVLHEAWPGVAGVDLLAVGYGEWLVPALVRWIRSGYTTLEPPLQGRVVTRAGTPVLYSGVPECRNLDDLVRPDWALAKSYHGHGFDLVHYESVRGCPYRCQFCNYPYLFDDTVFRTKSAERIATDWAAYAEGGARIINCLDSLFTVPRKRLLTLCDALVDLDLDLQWICYARADDLVWPGTVERMRKAGCIQVQVGIESGNQRILDNMDKRCTVEANLRAMHVCREEGVSTMVSVILGFPGETDDTIRATLEHLRDGTPDFYYASPFSVQVDKLPVMSDQNRARFGLQVNRDPSSFRYWRHDTMDCAQVAEHVAWFNETMMRDGISLDASLFYEAIPAYCRATDRDDLLAFQRATLDAAPWLRGTLRRLGRWTQGRLERDMANALPSGGVL